MAEVTRVSSVAELRPGDVLCIPSMEQVNKLENFILDTMVCRGEERDRSDFLGRVALSKMLYPKDFHGTIHGIEFRVMEDPERQLRDTLEAKTPMYPKCDQFPIASPVGSYLAQCYGFIVTAEATTSSGRGKVGGGTMMKVWYGAPAQQEPRLHNLKDGSTKLHTPKLSALRRYATKVEGDLEAYEQLLAQSRRIGRNILQNNMRHLIIQSITQ
jgi:hypothetical protein